MTGTDAQDMGLFEVMYNCRAMRKLNSANRTYMTVIVMCLAKITVLGL